MKGRWLSQLLRSCQPGEAPGSLYQATKHTAGDSSHPKCVDILQATSFGVFSLGRHLVLGESVVPSSPSPHGVVGSQSGMHRDVQLLLKSSWGWSRSISFDNMVSDSAKHVLTYWWTRSQASTGVSYPWVVSSYLVLDAITFSHC